MNPRSLALYQLRHEPVLKNHAIMLDNIIICRLYRTIWRPKKATKSATFEIPNWFHKSLKNQRHICSTFIRKFVNDVWSSKQWTSDSLEQRLFLRPFWPYSLHTFSLVSLVKKYATCKAKMAFQKAFVHGNLTFIVFLIPSLTFFIMNVEKIQYYGRNVYFLNPHYREIRTMGGRTNRGPSVFYY